jgi:hypothetical protein
MRNEKLFLIQFLFFLFFSPSRRNKEWLLRKMLKIIILMCFIYYKVEQNSKDDDHIKNVTKFQSWSNKMKIKFSLRFKIEEKKILLSCFSSIVHDLDRRIKLLIASFNCFQVALVLLQTDRSRTFLLHLIRLVFILFLQFLFYSFTVCGNC